MLRNGLLRWSNEALHLQIREGALEADFGEEPGHFSRSYRGTEFELIKFASLFGKGEDNHISLPPVGEHLLGRLSREERRLDGF